MSDRYCKQYIFLLKKTKFHQPVIYSPSSIRSGLALKLNFFHTSLPEMCVFQFFNKYQAKNSWGARGGWSEQWKKGPCLFRAFRGWNPTQLCGDYFISNKKNKDPGTFKNQCFMKSLRPGVFRGSSGEAWPVFRFVLEKRWVVRSGLELTPPKQSPCNFNNQATQTKKNVWFSSLVSRISWSNRVGSNLKLLLVSFVQVRFSTSTEILIHESLRPNRCPK